MPRVCTICSHPERAEIDAALVAGAPFRNIAQRFGTSPTAVFRHREHIPGELAEAHDAEDVARADDLLAQLRALQSRTMAILAVAEKDGKLGAALSAISQARANLELLGKLVGQLDERATVNILMAPDWLAVRGALLSALEPHPAARVAVAERLALLEASNGHRG